MGSYDKRRSSRGQTTVSNAGSTPNTTAPQNSGLGNYEKRRANRYNESLPKKEQPRSYVEVKTELAKAERLRDEASKKRQNYSGRGKYLMYADPTIANAMNLQTAEDAEFEFQKYDAEYNRLRTELYELENQNKRKALGSDADAQKSYAAGTQARSDLKTLAESLLPTSIPGSDLPFGFKDYEQMMRQLEMEDLRQKYGANDHIGLAARIKAAEGKAASDLEKSGYNFDRMADYEQRQLDAANREKEKEENLRYANEHGFLSSVSTIPAAVAQGVDYIKFAGQTLANEMRGENDWRPVNTANMHATNYVKDVRGQVGENIENKTDWTIGGQNVSRFLYDTAMSMGDSATAIMLAGPAATYLLGGAAASQTAIDVLENGGTAAQATMSGLAAGAAEAFFEKYSVEKLLEARDVTSMKRLLVGTGQQAFTEASEEMLTEVSNMLTNAVIMGQNSDYNRSIAFYMSEQGGSMSEEEAKKQFYRDCLKQVVWAGVGGALSGGVMSVGANTLNLAGNAALAKQVYGDDPEVLISQALAADNRNQLAKKLQDRVRNKQNISGLQLSTLNEQRLTAFEKQRKAQEKSGEYRLTIEAASQKYGKQAEAMLTTYNAGQDVEKFDKAFGNMHYLAKLGVAYDIAVEDESVSYLTDGQKKLAYDIGRTADGAVELADEVSEYEISAEEKTVQKSTDKVVQLAEVISVDGGTMTFALSDGSEAVSTDLSYATEDEAVLYSAVNYAANTAADANIMIGGYADSGMTADAYSAGIRHAFNYGRNQMPMAQMMSIPDVKKLPAAVRKAAYEAGKNLRVHRTGRQQAAVEQGRKSGKKADKVGRVLRLNGTQQVQSFREHQTQNGRQLTEVQEASIYGMERLSALMGVDMYVYESYVNSKGERVYRDDAGREYAAPNGYYENGKVYIDLNAGDYGEGTMLFTVSHELTHFIKEWSPAKYDILCEILMDGYAREGISVDRLVREQMYKAQQNGRKISYEDALEEVVADSMESMIADGRVVEMMAELKQRDKTLWEKIRDFFADLLDDLKAMVDAYKGYKPNSKEGRMVAEMQDVINKIQPIFAEALLDAGDAYQTTTKNTAEDGGVKYQIREIGNSGKFYVQADRQVMSGNDPEQWGKQIAKYINEEIRNGQDIAIPTSDGHILLLTGRSSYKLTDRHASAIYNQVKVLLPDEEYALKGRAASHIDELIQVARFTGYRSDVDGKHENDIGEDGFNYFEAYFMDFDGKYYQIPFSAGLNDTEETVYSVGKIRQRRLPAGTGSSPNKEALKNGRKPSGNSIRRSMDESQGKTVVQIAFEKAQAEKEARSARKNSFRNATAIDGVASAEQRRAGMPDFQWDDAVLANDKGGRKYSERNKKRITASMTDTERTEILKDKVITAAIYEGQADNAIRKRHSDLESGKMGLVKSALVRIGEEFDVFTDYKVSDVEVKFTLSRSNLKESVSKDVSGVQLAKLLPVLKQTVENAVGIECHANRYYYDNDTVMFENLLGGYVDEDSFVPVRFGLKHSKTGQVTLYVVVDQNPIGVKKIKAEVVKTPGTHSVQPVVSRSAYNYSVPSVIPFVNGKDLLRYLPDDMLTADQKKVKWEAIADTIIRTNNKNDKKYAEYIRDGKIDAAKQMVITAAKTAGYNVEAWHGTPNAGFTVFDRKKIGSTTDDGLFGQGFYFTTNKLTADGYATPSGKTMDVYLRAEKPWWSVAHKNIHEVAEELDMEESALTYRRNAISKRIVSPQMSQAGQFTAHLMERGYDSVVVQHGANDYEIVVFNPEQIKSAAVITYDENDNIIPISQRFNSQNPDIRFSDRNRTAQKTAAALERENKRLKQDIKYLRELVRLQKKVTGGTKMKRADVENMAKLLMKNNNIKGDYRELSPMLTELYEFMAANEDIGVDAIREKAQPAVDWMLNHVKKNRQLDPYAEEILGVLKSSTVRFNDGQKAEAASLAGGWGKYRNSVIGAVGVSDKSATTLDQLWADLSRSYPAVFDADIPDTQQPAALLEIIEDLRSMKHENYDFDSAMLEQAFMQDVYDGYWRVSTLDTVADIYQKRIDELKAIHFEEMEQSKAALIRQMDLQEAAYQQFMDETLAEERAQVQKQKDEYSADRREAVEKRKKTARKKSIQKTAHKLDALLNRGTKENNIKEGMQEFVSRALSAANAIMQTDNELDYIRFGVAVELTSREREVFEKAQGYLKEIDAYWEIEDAYDSYDEIKRTINKLERYLSDLKDLHGREIAARKRMNLEVPEDFSVIDMINEPIHCFISNREAQKAEAVKELQKQVYQLKPSELGEYKKMKRLESRLNYRMKQLSDVFERERNRRDKMTVSTILNDLAVSYKALEGATGYLSGAYNVEVYEYLDSLKDKIGKANVKDMSLYQLECIDEAFTMVYTTVKNVNEAFTDERKRSITEMGETAMSELKGQKQIPEEETKTGRMLKRFHWNNMKPVYAFERIGSVILKERFNAVRKGEDIYAQDVTEARQFWVEKCKEYGFNDWDLDERFEFEDSHGKKFKLDRNQMMSIYAYSRREQAIEHFMEGGIVIDTNTDIKGEKRYGVPVNLKPTTANTYHIGVETLEKISQTLTEAQRKFAQELQDYLSNEMAAKGNEVSLKMYGIKLFKEKHYFPLRSAPQYNAKAKDKQEQGETASPKRLKNSGMTKAVTPGANNPIILSGFMETWSGHVDEMSMYHAFVLPMEDFIRVYNYNVPASEGAASVDAALQNAHGAAATQYISQLIDDLNGGARSDPRENTMKQFVAKWKKASVFTSLSVVIQQPSSIGRAFALINPKYFHPSDFVTWGNSHEEVWDEIKKYAPVAIIKEMGYFDTNMGQSTADFLVAKDYGKWRDNFAENIKAMAADSQYRDDQLSRLPALADEKTWCTIWGAVKRELSAQEPKADVHSAEFLEKCGDRFTEVITKTQVYDSVLARSGNMRSKGMYMSMATAFLGEPTTSINMVEDAIYKAVHGGDKATAAKTIGAVVCSVVLNSMLVSLIYAMRDDDEDETFGEKYISRLASEVFDGLNPLTYLPIVKDIYSLFQGYDIERADMSLFADLVNAVTNLSVLLLKDMDDMDDEEIAEHWRKIAEQGWGMVDYSLALFGIPFKNVRREINAVINTGKTLYKDATERDQSALSMKDAVWEEWKKNIPILGMMPNASKSDKLFNATVMGDKAYVKRLNASFVTESARNSALKKGLRENDPRIKEAAVLYVTAESTGDYTAFNKLKNKIISEKKFDQNTIISAISTEVNKLIPDEVSKTSGKIKGMYTEENFLNAVARGKIGSADIIKEEIISIYVSNGESRDDAEDKFISNLKSDIRERLKNGEISDDAAYDLFVTYTDMDADEAQEEIYLQQFKREHDGVNDITMAAVIDYYDYAEPAGVEANIFYDAWKQYNKTQPDYTASGSTVRNSKTKKLMPYIDSLPLTADQKTALALCWWAPSTVRKYKLW